MNYNDIPLGVKVQICVSNGSDMQAKFISRVMKTGDKSLLVIPFMKWRTGKAITRPSRTARLIPSKRTA